MRRQSRWCSHNAVRLVVVVKVRRYLGRQLRGENHAVPVESRGASHHKRRSAVHWLRVGEHARGGGRRQGLVRVSLRNARRRMIERRGGSSLANAVGSGGPSLLVPSSSDVVGGSPHAGPGRRRGAAAALGPDLLRASLGGQARRGHGRQLRGRHEGR